MAHWDWICLRHNVPLSCPASAVSCSISCSQAAGSATAGLQPAAKQSPLRKRLSQLFSGLSPDTATAQQQRPSVTKSNPKQPLSPGEGKANPKVNKPLSAVSQTVCAVHSPSVDPAATPSSSASAAKSIISPVIRQLSAAGGLGSAALQTLQAASPTWPPAGLLPGLQTAKATVDLHNTSGLHAQHTAAQALPSSSQAVGQPSAVFTFMPSTGGLYAAEAQGSSGDVGTSPAALQPRSPAQTPAVLRYSMAPSTSSADDNSHWLRSPLTGQGIGRSMSETVHHLFADVQFSRDCAQALSLQLGDLSRADMQQLRGESLSAWAGSFRMGAGPVDRFMTLCQLSQRS